MANTVSELIEWLSHIERPETTVVVVSEDDITEIDTEYVDLSWALANELP